MLILLLVIFTIVFILIIIYLNMPSLSRGGDKRITMAAEPIKENRCCTDELDLVNVKSEILNKLDQLKASVDKKKVSSGAAESSGGNVFERFLDLDEEIKSHLEPTVRDVKFLKNVVEPLKDRLSYSEIDHIFNIINDIETKIKGLLAEYTTNHLNDLGKTVNSGFGSIVGYKNEIITKIEQVKTVLENKLPPGNDIVAAVSGLIDRIKNNYPPLSIDKDVGEIKNQFKIIDSKLITDTEIKTEITKIKTILDEKLFSLGDDVINQLNGLENKLKNHFQPPILILNELKDILVEIKNKSINSEIDSALSVINSIESKITTALSKAIEKPRENINSILKQFENINLKSELTKLDNTVTSETKAVVIELKKLKTKMDGLDKKSCDASKFVKEVTDLENKFENFMELPVKKISEILQKLNTIPTTPAAAALAPEAVSPLFAQQKTEIKNELNDLKVYFNKPIKDIAELKNIFVPIKSTLSPSNIGNVANVLRSIENNILNKFETKFSELRPQAAEVINHMNVKEEEMKEFFIKLDTNTNLFRNLRYANEVLNELGKSNGPDDVANVFSSLQRFIGYFEKLEKMIKRNLRLGTGGDKTLTIKQVIDGLKSVLLTTDD